MVEVPEYIVSTFMPSLQPLLARYPFAFRLMGALLAVWYLGPFSRLQSLWNQFSTLLVSCVNVSSEEDLFDYLITHLSETRTLRADQSLNAMSNIPREQNRRSMRDPPEESNRKAAANNETPKLKYEQTEGVQLFVWRRRLFWAARRKGEGSVFTGRGYKNAEVLSVSCLGRSTAPIKAFLEHIYYLNKDKERTLTIIRRPYTGGYGGRLAWSRITAKPRRALDTVILEHEQKTMVLKDIEEYMDESTSTFYGKHGIPYRRGYLFHGPPGVGKTSFALALANKFNLDVYVLTLLDQNLNDSDLISLLNQLPGRSLLLLEDIDTAGLSSRKSKPTSTSAVSFPGMPDLPGLRREGGPRRRGGGGGSRGGLRASTATTESKRDTTDADSDDDELAALTSKVSLSGLLNAIDGVAAPEGHILIMTTNKPHDLDDALVRAGRISVRVAFDNASKTQAREIFLRMYVDLPSPPAQSAGEAVGAVADVEKGRYDTQIPPRLAELADTFAEALPEKEFSPADLQDYLLVHKRDAEKAVQGLERWMETKREEGERKEEGKEVERLLRRERRRVEEEGWVQTLRGVLKEGGNSGGGGGARKGAAGMPSVEDFKKMMNRDLEELKGGGKVGKGEKDGTDENEETADERKDSGDVRGDDKA